VATVRDHDGQQLSYVYFEDEPGRRVSRPIVLLQLIFILDPVIAR
jgi:hypothetical protein